VSATDKVIQPEDVEKPLPPKKDQAAAWLAQKCATVEFGLFNIFVVAVWAIVHVEPFPFPFLTLVLSIEAILLTVFVLVEQRLQTEMQRREVEADLKNDAIAAEQSQEIKKQLNRIERLLKEK
jgi:uncharacterized membrane protein